MVSDYSMELKPTIVATLGPAQAWGHRNVTSRVSEFTNPVDERVLRVTFDPHEPKEYFSPPHRHNFDQLRFVSQGEVEFGKSLVAGVGDLVYFPAGTSYGITVRSESTTVFTVQTQAPNWAFFPTRAQAASGAEALRKVGELDREKGVFRWPDGRHQDSYEAVWEHLTGSRLKYPSSRYANPCLIHSSGFEWLPTEYSGIQLKTLGSFNRIGPKVSLVQMNEGAQLGSCTASRHQLLGVVEGSVRYADGQTLESGGRMYVPPGAVRERLSADRQGLLLVIQFEPRGVAESASLEN